MSSLFDAATKAFVKQRRKILSKKIYDRAVVMSEGRKFFGEWLVIEF